MTAPQHRAPLLSVRNLAVSFPSEAGRVDAVRGVDFDLHPGRTLAIVGESGSGKSVTSMAVMGLLPDYASVTGSIALDGREFLELDDRQMSKIRGRDIGMIFQDPLSSLTPIFSVGRRSSRRWRSTRAWTATSPGNGRCNCSTWSGSPTRRSGPDRSRMSSPAGCGSGW